MTDERVQAIPMQQKAKPKSTHNFISRFFIKKVTRFKLKRFEDKKVDLWDKKLDSRVGSDRWVKLANKIKEIGLEEEKLKRKLELL